jgi:pyruvate,water dikinase
MFLHRIKVVFASLYNDRAISYRVHKGFAHERCRAQSAGIQRMVRSDLGAAGVMFTIDTESGFEDLVFITSSYGLGETVVQGAVKSGRVLRTQTHPARGQTGHLMRRSLGLQADRNGVHLATGEGETGKLVKTVEVPTEQRNRFSLTDCRC